MSMNTYDYLVFQLFHLDSNELNVHQGWILFYSFYYKDMVDNALEYTFGVCSLSIVFSYNVIVYLYAEGIGNRSTDDKS